MNTQSFDEACNSIFAESDLNNVQHDDGLFYDEPPTEQLGRHTMNNQPCKLEPSTVLQGDYVNLNHRVLVEQCPNGVWLAEQDGDFLTVANTLEELQTKLNSIFGE